VRQHYRCRHEAPVISFTIIATACHAYAVPRTDALPDASRHADLARPVSYADNTVYGARRLFQLPNCRAVTSVKPAAEFFKNSAGA